MRQLMQKVKLDLFPKLDIKSTFITAHLEGGKPQIHKFTLRNDYIITPEKYTFTGYYDAATRDYLNQYLKDSLTSKTTLLEACSAAYHCVVYATAAAEQRKILDSSVGGWAEVWTMKPKTKKRVYLPKTVDFPCEAKERLTNGECEIIRYEMRRIPGSAELQLDA